MKLILFFTLFFSCVLAQPWVMFSDMDDTYLYDQATGQVYIRTKKGGKNYEDSFVKMGVLNKDSKTQSKEKQKSAVSVANPTNVDKSEQSELLKKAQELQKSIQGGIFETTK